MASASTPAPAATPPPAGAAGSPGPGSPASPAAAPLAALIHACEAYALDWTAQATRLTAIDGLAAAALAAAERADGSGATLLAATLADFKWGAEAPLAFARPLDVRSLAQRLKLLLYDAVAPCGSGTFSAVLAAHCRLTGARVALKRLHLHAGADEGVPTTALREVSLLRELGDGGSPHIVQ